MPADRARNASALLVLVALLSLPAAQLVAMSEYEGAGLVLALGAAAIFASPLLGRYARHRAALAESISRLPLEMDRLSAVACGGPPGLRVRALLRQRRLRWQLKVRIEGLDPRLEIWPRRLEGEGGESTGDARFDGQVVTRARDPEALARLDEGTRASLMRFLLREGDRLRAGALEVAVVVKSPRETEAELEALMALAERLRAPQTAQLVAPRSALPSLRRALSLRWRPQLKTALVMGTIAALVSPALLLWVPGVEMHLRSLLWQVAGLTLSSAYVWFAMAVIALGLLGSRVTGQRHARRLARSLEGLPIEPRALQLAHVDPEAVGTFEGRLVRLRVTGAALEIQMAGAAPSITVEPSSGVYGARPIGDPEFDAAFACSGARTLLLALLDEPTRHMLRESGLRKLTVSGGSLRAVVPMDAPTSWGVRAALEHANAVLSALSPARVATPGEMERRLLTNAREDPAPGVRLRCLDRLLRMGASCPVAEEARALAGALGGRLHLAEVAGGFSAPDPVLLRALLQSGELGLEELREARSLLGRLAPSGGGAFALVGEGEGGEISVVDGGRGAVSLSEGG
jgi:hypothetical protein